jgi:cytochrome c
LVALLAFDNGVAAQSASSGGRQDQPVSGVGRPPTPVELKAWDIAVSPDGRELPPGSGTAVQGESIYVLRRCAECHGPTAKEGPGPNLVRDTPTRPGTASYSVAYWPFAPKLWDYIYRAMPYDQAGVLTADEAYALTAVLLYKNGIIQKDAEMNATTLPKVVMPHRDRYSVTAPTSANAPRAFKILPE